MRVRGDEAVREWALRLDGAEPAPAVATEVPAEAVLALAGACGAGTRRSGRRT